MSTRDKILELIKKHKFNYTKKIKKDVALMQWIVDNATVETTEFTELIFSALYKENNICKYNMTRKYLGLKEGYGFCGRTGSCKCCDEHLEEKRNAFYEVTTKEQWNDIVEQRQKTCIEKYGVDNAFKSEVIKQKSKKTKLQKYGDENYNNREKFTDTMMERYGVEHALQNKDVADKWKNTNLEKYGFEYGVMNTEIREKQLITLLHNYNVENPRHIADYEQKSKKTKLQRYGDENYINREQYIETMLNRYGVEHALQNPTCMAKMKNTTKKTAQEKYGRDHYMLAKFSENTFNKINDKEWLIEQHITLKKNLHEIADDLGDISSTTIAKYLKEFNIDIIANRSKSSGEQLLVQFIQENYNTEIIRNTKKLIKPKEIDIYLPKYKLAIEFNGRHWHSPELKGGETKWFEYHENKIRDCKEKGIELLHIWEDYGDYKKLIQDAINGDIENDLEKILLEVKWQ